uniref:hypothetical protein n=1 Tax=Pseudactinotalea sp. TaxID=1926260 RepID=UPI003B3AC69B
IAAGATTRLEVPSGTLAVVFEGSGILASAILAGEAADGTLIAAYPITGDPYTEQSVAVRVTD